MTTDLQALRSSLLQPALGGGGRIRTYEGVSRQIYSLLPLAAWVPLRRKTSRVFSCRTLGVSMSLARYLLGALARDYWQATPYYMQRRTGRPEAQLGPPLSLRQNPIVL
jgi:hypothetical protein